MDLVTYLKNTNNEELYLKLRIIVELYKERENNKKAFIKLNNDYNEYLTEKHENELKKRKATTKRIDKKLDIVDIIVSIPLLLIWIIIILPPQLLLVVNLLILPILNFKLLKIRKKETLVVEDEFIDFLEKHDQEKKYKKLCKARELYHAKRKELESVLLNISRDDLKLINDFYGALEEYETLLDHLATDIKLPQEKNIKKLEHKINC